MSFRSIKTLPNGDQKSGATKSSAVQSKEVRVVIPEKVELFLDDADEPHILIPQVKGRKLLPTKHRLVRSFVVNYLFKLSNGRLPSSADVDALISVLEAQALLNGRKEQEDSDWKDNLLDEDPLTLCLFTLTMRKSPQSMEATAGQILEAVNLMAAKENIEKSEDWPKSTSQMSISIDRRRLMLKELGVIGTKLPRQGMARKWRFEMQVGDGGDAGATPPSHAVSQPNSLRGQHLQVTAAENDALFASLVEITAGDVEVNPLTENEILQWVPDTWKEFHANESAVEELSLIVNDLMVGSIGHNLLLTGDSGTGRDALIIHAVRALLCYQCPELDPCGECTNSFGSVDSTR